MSFLTPTVSQLPSMSEALSLLKSYPDQRSRYLRFRYSPPMSQGVIPNEISVLVNGQPYFRFDASGVVLHYLALVSAIAVEEIQINGETYFLRISDRVILNRMGSASVAYLK